MLRQVAGRELAARRLLLFFQIILPYEEIAMILIMYDRQEKTSCSYTSRRRAFIANYLGPTSRVHAGAT